MRIAFSPFLASLVVIGVATSCGDAASIAPGDLTDGDATYTTPDGKVTLTPFAAGGGAGTLGVAGCCFGVTGGTNNVAVTDGDGDPLTTADREALDIALAADAYLTDLNFIFTRANGPNADDGIEISGFSANPGASLDAGAAGDGVTTTYSSGTLYVNHGWRGGNVTTVSFSNSLASFGQTITIGANDSDETASQAALNGIGYQAIPEPTTFLLAGVALVALAGGRKRN